MKLRSLPLVVVAFLLSIFGAVVACFVHLLTDRGRLLLRIEALEADAAGRTADRRPSRLPAGSVLNDFDLPLLTGGRAALSRWRGRPLLLLVVQPGCAASRRLLTGLAGLVRDGQLGERALVIVSTGAPEVNQRLVAETGVDAPVLLQEEWEVAQIYRIDRTPAACQLDAEGRTERDLALGAEVWTLAERAWAWLADGDERLPADTTPAPVAAPVGRDGLAPGVVAPDVRAPLLDGGEVALRDLRGRSVLLVFWEPACPACDGLLPALERAQARHPGARVLVIARGDPERLRQATAGVALPIAVQRRREVARAFATFEMPAAYLIDPDGAIATPVAIGADRVRTLANRLGEATTRRARQASPAVNGAAAERAPAARSRFGGAPS